MKHGSISTHLRPIGSQLSEWLELDESRAMCPNMLQSAAKILANIFGDACGRIFIYYFENRKTLTKALLDCLNRNQKENTPHG